MPAGWTLQRDVVWIVKISSPPIDLSEIYVINVNYILIDFNLIVSVLES